MVRGRRQTLDRFEIRLRVALAQILQACERHRVLSDEHVVECRVQPLGPLRNARVTRAENLLDLVGQTDAQLVVVDDRRVDPAQRGLGLRRGRLPQKHRIDQLVHRRNCQRRLPVQSSDKAVSR